MTLEIITSDCLAPLKHGFFTRKGGASSGIFEGLNCGMGSSDLREAVEMNRARAAAAMGAGPREMASVHQIHSSDVVTLSASEEMPRKADGLVTNTPGLVLSILTADCQPVLFADKEAGVIGAAHAGWRGALNGILEKTTDAMIALGAVRKNICAVIGPTISQKAYEVGPEFVAEFSTVAQENERFFIAGSGDRSFFDLPGYSLARLQNLGLRHFEWTRHCTYSDANRFFSYRRSVHKKEADYGRLISTIRL